MTEVEVFVTIYMTVFIGFFLFAAYEVVTRSV